MGVTFELGKKFLELEKENHWFEIRVKGHKFWDYVRYAVFNAIANEYNEEVPERRPGTAIGYLIEAMVYFVYYLVDTLKTRGKRYDIIFVNNTDRTNKIGGKEVNQWYYPVIKHLHPRYKILFVDPYPGEIAGKYPCDLLRIRFLCLFDRIKSLFIRFTEQERNVFSDIQSKLWDELSVKVDMYDITRDVFPMQIQGYKRYLKLFGRYSPRIVAFCDNGYMRGMMEAAQESKTTTINLQHSQISYLETLYNYDGDVSSRDIVVSDYIFTFSDFWHKEFRLPGKKVSVGFPLREMNTRISNNKAQKTKNILVISDGFYARESPIIPELADLLPDYTIYYKLRPGEYKHWREKYGTIWKKPNLVMIEDNKLSLYDYFLICPYQIGVGSTALYEGLCFNPVTFILKVGWYEEMRGLYEDGYAFLVSSAGEIAEKIKGDVRPAKKLEPEEIFKSNSLQNIEREIEKILKA